MKNTVQVCTPTQESNIFCALMSLAIQFKKPAEWVATQRPLDIVAYLVHKGESLEVATNLIVNNCAAEIMVKQTKH